MDKQIGQLGTTSINLTIWHSILNKIIAMTTSKYCYNIHKPNAILHQVLILILCYIQIVPTFKEKLNGGKQVDILIFKNEALKILYHVRINIFVL